MTKTDTRNVEATLLQIWALEAAGCDIVRCAVPVKEAAGKLGGIKRQMRVPLLAHPPLHPPPPAHPPRSGCGWPAPHPRQHGRKENLHGGVRRRQGAEDPDPD